MDDAGGSSIDNPVSLDDGETEVTVKTKTGEAAGESPGEPEETVPARDEDEDSAGDGSHENIEKLREHLREEFGTDAINVPSNVKEDCFIKCLDEQFGALRNKKESRQICQANCEK